jgi:hypothetical protein
MKNSKLASVFILALLCTIASGANGDPKAQKINPPLAGLNKISINIRPGINGPFYRHTFWDKITETAQQKLKDKTFDVVNKIVIHDGQRPQNIFHLQVDVDIIQPIESQTALYRVKTSLIMDVRLHPRSSDTFKADIWIACSTGTGQGEEIIEKLVLSQIDTFLNDWEKVNGPAPEKAEVKRVDEEQSAFVASKNSRVFHKPGCSSAKSIQPYNLVYYNSKEEATAAGKRPCQRCKP